MIQDLYVWVGRVALSLLSPRVVAVQGDTVVQTVSAITSRISRAQPSLHE